MIEYTVKLTKKTLPQKIPNILDNLLDYMQGVQLFPPVTQNFKILEIHKLEKRLHMFRFGSRIFSLNTSYYMM